MQVDPKLEPCPFCGGTAFVEGPPEARMVTCDRCAVSTIQYEDETEAIAAWNRRALSASEKEGAEAKPGRLRKISDLISELQETKSRFGDTCVYIRRGGMAWGAVALNRLNDDTRHGVFDLQADHDRRMGERLAQIDRLITDRNEWRDRASVAEAAAAHPSGQGADR